MNQIPSRHRTRSTSVNSERYSTSESVDLQSPTSPHQLKNLGKSPSQKLYVLPLNVILISH